MADEPIGSLPLAHSRTGGEQLVVVQDGETRRSGTPLQRLLGSGTPSSNTYLRGDGVWAAPPDREQEVGYASSYLVQAGIVGTVTDLTGLAITFDVGDEPVWVEMYLPCLSSAGATNFVEVFITDASNVAKAKTWATVPGSSYDEARVIERISVPGTYTRKGRFNRLAGGSGTVSNNGPNDPLVTSWVQAYIR